MKELEIIASVTNIRILNYSYQEDLKEERSDGDVGSLEGEPRNGVPLGFGFCPQVQTPKVWLLSRQPVLTSVLFCVARGPLMLLFILLIKNPANTLAS